MKRRIVKPIRVTITALAFVIVMTFILVACNNGSGTSNNTFPNINDKDIPDILEKTVGTLGNTYFASGISDNEDYSSYLSIIFEKTTETDYTTLMEHYQSDSMGTDEDGYLLFDWGRILVTPNNGSISVNALIK